MKKIWIITALLAIAIAGIGQTAAGKWKLVVGYTLSYADTKNDFLKAMYTEEPCMQKTVFVFTASGQINAENNNCKQADPDEALGAGAKYRVKGNKLTLITVDDMEGEVFELEIKGNRMTWRKTYEKNSGVNPKDDVKLLEYVFERS